MAKVLEGFEFRRTRGSTQQWDGFLDGQAHQLDEGTDYTGDAKKTQASIHQAGRRLGLKVKTQRVEGGIVVQAVGPLEVVTLSE